MTQIDDIRTRREQEQRVHDGEWSRLVWTMKVKPVPFVPGETDVDVLLSALDAAKAENERITKIAICESNIKDAHLEAARDSARRARWAWRKRYESDIANDTALTVAEMILADRQEDLENARSEVSRQVHTIGRLKDKFRQVSVYAQGAYMEFEGRVKPLMEIYELCRKADAIGDDDE